MEKNTVSICRQQDIYIDKSKKPKQAFLELMVE